MEPCLRLERFPHQTGREPGTARSVGQRLNFSAGSIYIEEFCMENYEHYVQCCFLKYFEQCILVISRSKYSILRQHDIVVRGENMFFRPIYSRYYAEPSG